MTRTIALNMRIGGALGEFVAAKVGDGGAYENVSEYVRDLIRRDMALVDGEAFAQLKAELAQAFVALDSAYQPLSADTVIRRNASRGPA